MPQRPRSHQLEEESRTKFRQSVPSVWVTRKADPDYGIDEQVEVFDEDGSATGLLFLVQLKGTDSQDEKEALAVSMPLETLKYYRRLELPVMIVSYHAPSGTLFWRWFHEFDEHGQTGKKTITFRIPEENRWNSETPQRVKNDLESFRELKSARVKWPIEFELVFDEASLSDTPAVLVESALRQAFKPLAGLIRLRADFPLGAHPTLRISSKKIAANLAGLNSVTLPVKEPYEPSAVTAVLPYDAMFAIAILFDRLGHTDAAAKVLSVCLDKSVFRREPKLFLGCVGVFVRAGRISDALSVAERFLSKAGEKFLGELLLLPVLMREQALNAAEEQFYLHLRKLIIERAEEAGYLALAGAAHYNLGNYLRSQGDPHYKAAFRHYRLAVKRDPGYRKRQYFWMELGGVLFGLGRYSQAAKAYDKALDIDPKRVAVRALMADALMFAGEYGSAVGKFEEYLEQESSIEPEWYLKAFALEGLMKLLGIDQQKRQPKGATKLADVTGLPPEARQERLLTVLKADALCGLAWFNLGVECMRQGRRGDAFIAFLLAGLINEYDPQAWTNTISLGLSVKEHHRLMPAVLAVAYDKNGEKIVETIHQLLEQQPSNIPKQEILAALQECFRSVSPRRRDRVLRFIEKDEKYREIDLNKPSEEG